MKEMKRPDYTLPDYNEEWSRSKKVEWSKKFSVRRVDTKGRICRHAVIKTGGCSRKLGPEYLACREYSLDCLDHWDIWQRQDGSRFVLAHVYEEDKRKALKTAFQWAHPRGLIVLSDPEDYWYGFGTLPLRFELAQGRWAVRVGQDDVEFFQKLVDEEPRLLDLLAQVRAVRDDKSDEGFCANAIWYGRRGSYGIKGKMGTLVGWRRGEPEDEETQVGVDPFAKRFKFLEDDALSRPPPSTISSVLERWRAEGPKPPLELKTIGWDEISAPLPPVPEGFLHSEEAYGGAYRILYDMLPPCRPGPRCGCA